MTTKRLRGTCAVCGYRAYLRRNLTIGFHKIWRGPNWFYCAGEGKPPAVDQEVVTC